MKVLWTRVAAWVVWRWTLPVRYRELEGLLAKQRKELLARGGAAQQAEIWKGKYERLAECNKAALEKNLKMLTRNRALEDGETASGLSAAEVERLALLAMAAGKLAADVAKVILHGWKSPSPFTGRPIYTEVEHSLGRLDAAAELMGDAGDVRGGDVYAHACRTRKRLDEQMTRQQ